MFHYLCLREIEFSRETIPVPSLRENVLLSTFKIASIMSKNVSVRESHAIVIRNLGRLTFLRKPSANVLKSDASK